MLESYVSSYHCVGRLSYKLNNGRDVAFLGFGRGEGGEKSGEACKGVWKHAGVGGWSASRKGIKGQGQLSLFGEQREWGLKSLLSTTVLLPPVGVLFEKHTEEKRSCLSASS